LSKTKFTKSCRAEEEEEEERTLKSCRAEEEEEEEERTLHWVIIICRALMSFNVDILSV